MSQSRYVPDFRIWIDGEPIPETMRASVAAVNHVTGFDAADRVEIALTNEGLRWLDHPLLKLDRSVKLSLGYAPEALEQVFVGEVVGQEANFPSDDAPSLTVVAQDRRHRLQQGTKVRWFAVPIPSFGNVPIPDLATSAIVSAENLLIPLPDPIGAAISILLGGVEAIAVITDPGSSQKFIRKQMDESDFDFLMRLAKENAWNMFIDHRGSLGGCKLRFQSPLSNLSPDVVLKYGESLIEFNPRVTSVGQIVSVCAYVWIPPIKTTLVVTIGWDWDRQALSLSVYPAVVPIGQGPSSHLIEEPVTVFNAPRRIISELLPKLNNRLTGVGVCLGDPRIRPGTVLRLEGLGETFGGLYRVISATNTFDRNGYRTRFEVCKEIWFGSIPPMEQGAIPIRMNGLATVGIAAQASAAAKLPA